jgi:hypothetical protein
MWKEAIVAEFKVLSLNLHGEHGEYHEEISLDSLSLDRELNADEAEVLPTLHRCSNSSDITEMKF